MKPSKIVHSEHGPCIVETRVKITARGVFFLVGLTVLLCIGVYFLMDAITEDKRRTAVVDYPHEVSSSIEAQVGVAATMIDTNATYLLGGDTLHPMQSVYKFPLALSVLKRVDEGKWRLDENMNVSAEDLPPNTWSPMRDKFPRGGEFTLRELIRYAVQESDNNACDYLFRLIGGPTAVQADLSVWGIDGIEVCSTEAEMHATPRLQYCNACRPLAMNALLKAFDGGHILKPVTQKVLWEMMVTCQTGQGRLKGLLSGDYVVAHKTGTGMVKDGIISAVNDVGMIVLQDGRKMAVSIFIKDAKASMDDCERVIAQITCWLCESWAKGQSK